MIRVSFSSSGLPRRADGPLAHRLRGTSGISPQAAAAIAAAITVQEGAGPGTLATRNNNPGNLVYVGQAGATQGAGGFAAFPTPAAGQAALVAQIELDASRGTDVTGKPTTTISELIASWAPPDKNDTAAYVASVGIQTGYDVGAPLSSLGSPDSGGTVVTSTFDTGSASPVTSDYSFGLPDLSALDLTSMSPLWLAGAAAAALVLFRVV